MSGKLNIESQYKQGGMYDNRFLVDSSHILYSILTCLITVQVLDINVMCCHTQRTQSQSIKLLNITIGLRASGNERNSTQTAGH